MTLKDNIRNNLFGFAIGKAANFAGSLVLIRKLGPEESGIYFSALGFAFLFSILVNQGVGAYVTQQVSRNRKQISEVLGKCFRFQLIQIFIATFLLLACVLIGITNPSPTLLVLVAFSGVVAGNVSMLFTSALEGLEEYKTVSMLNASCSLINAMGLWVVVLFFPDALLALSFWLFTSCIGVALWFMSLRKKIGFFSLRQKIDLLEMWRNILPFGGVSVFSHIYVKIDVAMITWMLGLTSVGMYSSMVRIIDFAGPFLHTASGPLFPRFGKLSRREKSKIKTTELLNKSLKILTVLCTMLGVFTALWSRDILGLLLGPEFIAGNGTLTLLIWVPVLSGIYTPLLHVINAGGKTRHVVGLLMLSVLVNVFSNFYLLPVFGVEGAAFSSVLCELLIFFGLIRILDRTLDISVSQLLPFFLGVLIGGSFYLVMAAPPGFYIKTLISSLFTLTSLFFLREYIFSYKRKNG